MRKLFAFSIVVILFSCSGATQSSKENDLTNNDNGNKLESPNEDLPPPPPPPTTAISDKIEKDCERSVHSGDVIICLPKIDGMTECYSVPKFKSYFDNFESGSNDLLGFYLNNSTYEKFKTKITKGFDDYFKVFVVKGTEGVRFSKSELDMMAQKMKSNYFDANWDQRKEELEKIVKNASFGKPVLLEKYSPNENARTFVVISKIQTETMEYVMAMTMNLLIVKNRLIFLTYYKDYDGQESIRKAKGKNDYIVLRFLNENN